MLALCTALFASCEIDEVPDPNNPSEGVISSDASLSEIQNVVDGTASAMRNSQQFYYEGVGVIGREYYRFSGSDPRYTSDLLGKGSAVLDNNTFYTNNPYAGRYRAIKNANILIDALTNTTASITEAQRAAGIAWAKTIKAHELLLVLNMQYNNGVRVDVADPDNLGPFLSYAESLNAIRDLLHEAETGLGGADSFPFKLGDGFAGFSAPADFAKFVHGLLARVHLYQADWAGALDEANESFMDNSQGADFYTGVYYTYSSAGGDFFNPLYYTPGSTGETLVAHSSYVTDAEAGDDRVNKVSARANIFQDDLTSDYDFAVYQTKTDPVAMLRNEELILIYAEASAQTNKPTDAVDAINNIRQSHGLGVYAGGQSTDELIDEILLQRRYSLYGEGHRWIDLRRYNKLNTLPIDRVGDDVWVEFPRPADEG
ncbi:MAG: RagB/SusD family nutrient uptake outer membrane protein [Bacteroidetes bacterium]|nr:RagB/SusD family nutrient uptake outer membrane protein [Bacteroidota bacterium]